MAESASKKFKQVFTQKYLKDIYQNNIQLNSATGIDRVNSKSFNENLDHNIDVIYRKVHTGRYHFSQYKEKLISRGAAKYPRVISIPTIRDKLTQRALFEILFEVYGASIPFLHKVIGHAIKSFNSHKYDYYIRLDVESFYPSIKHELLSEQISKRIRKGGVRQLIKDSIIQDTVAKPCGKKQWRVAGVPQGLSISNVLANIYMIPIDSKHSSQEDYKYFRYVDDIIVFCKEDQVERIKSEIKNDCDKLGLSLHEEGKDDSKSKVGNISEEFSYLGYKFGPSNISVRKPTVDKLRESIFRILTIYKHSREKNISRLYWTLNLRITGCIFDETKYGWIFYFSQITDMSLLKQLDLFLEKQLQRFGISSYHDKIKRFVRTYYEITKNLTRSNYIPKFDRYTISQKRQVLKDTFGITKERMTKEEIEKEFRWHIFKQVKELEQDLSRVS
ncbi:MAG: RNA-dependent DNA polymerase [Nitrospirae bacterium]|nr:RNA-dependent DNA polymerase [Nitrospirota bacterium]